ncbi:Clp protease N-terminal domain-containing protein [Streptomyces sp. SL13]|uniref:Clp protease N-terminal domain-containing protein n=1 Tax=Streptantibioticus silvisoli TaxID=2705255 RepID=A0AA90K8B7_9ACTN|nr:Clp protease N-terminal domain-containing protein [Streptantibioticus silvisoli]MDI5969282.1 Clp protease N-terminal domain-containing protein [Streptantibioticus silvisoli]
MLTDAVGRAAARGAGRIEGVDLLGALAADPDARAAEVLRAAGVDPARLAPPAADVAEG